MIAFSFLVYIHSQGCSTIHVWRPFSGL